jgi:hypothetical protein
MALSRLLERLKFIGEGAYSRVYEFGPNNVIKIPYDDDSGFIRLHEQRIRQAKFIVGWTQVLHDRLGGVVTPTTYHVGGAVVQRRAKERSWHELDFGARAKASSETRNLVEKAREICKLMNGDEFIVDGNESNFRFNDDGEVLEWFDPVVPPCRLFASSKNVLSDLEDDVW